VIPKRVFDALKAASGRFRRSERRRGRLEMRPKRLVDLGEEVLSAREAVKVRRGDAEIKDGRSKSWRTVKE